MRWWDESMFAVNTYEMMHRGNYFSLYFDGAPDLYNTKPPLTVWLQLASVKAFGYNETANLNGLKVYYTGYKGSLLFYKYKLAEMKQHIELTQSDVYKLHDKILVSDDSLLDILNAKYSCTILEQFNNAQVVQIEVVR